jgi:hypothetical protein
VTHAVVGVDHVQLAATPGCEEDARAFFGAVVGLDELEKPAALQARGGVWFACGAQQLHIGVAADFAPATKAHPGIRVEGLDDLRSRLTSAGYSVIDDDGTIPTERRFHVSDPFGNRLEFMEAA